LQSAGVKRCYGIVGDTLNRIAHAIGGRGRDGGLQRAGDAAGQGRTRDARASP
jgi:hypothetical protein